MTTPLLTYRDKSGVRVNLDSLIVSRLLLTANSGGGKSHALRQLLEETHGRVQQIIIDREGEFATLREKFPYLLVGPGGEVAADLRSAPMLARKLLELGVSAVIDLSEMDLKAQRQYVAAFCDSISHAPRSLWHDAIIVIDEAYLFAPQKMKAGDGAAALSLAAISLAASTWRKRGFCMVLATTRVSKLDKDVSGEMLNKLIGRTSEEDRKRAADELGIDANTARSLRSLSPGTFWAYGPAIADEPVLVQTPKDLKTTIPKRGAAREAAPPTPAAIRAIADALAELPKEAAEEERTIAGLKAELAKAKRELSMPKRAESVSGKQIEIAIDQAVAKERVRLMRESHAERDAFITATGRQLRTMVKFADDIEHQAKWLREAAEKFKKALPNGGEGYGGAVKSVGQVVHPERTARDKGDGSVRAAKPSRSTGPVHLSDGAALPSGERTVLTAIAQHDDGVTREQLTVLTGYKRSTRDAYIQRMSQKGLIELRGERIVATQEGVDALGSDFEPLPTGEALYEYWINGPLPTGEKAILKLCHANYPDAVSRDDLSTATGFARSSRDAYIQRLTARKLVTANREGVTMSAHLHG